MSGMVQGQRYQNYEAEGRFGIHLDPAATCPHLFVLGIDIGRCGLISQRTGLVFQGLQAWTATLAQEGSAMEHKLAEVDFKGGSQGAAPTPEEMEATVIRSGITEREMDAIASRMMEARVAAEESAFTVVSVPREPVERIKELYEQTVNAAAPPPEVAAQIRQIINDSALFS